ncbi:EamA family transporter [Dysgonomonas sp. ZJ709]|uniref:EamA family transporter n=1 Tax=Dysgonomonas sp. ZJ709 TaxID=2709797 RepID=UPI0013EBC625|nr:EamA family transporter [Dysgonomonas sp. ZJ709]
MSVLVIVAILLRVLSNPMGNVFQKQLTKKTISPLFINFGTYLLLGIACLLYIPFINISLLSAEFWLYAFLGGIMGALGNALLIKAFEKGDLSVLGPINSYKSVISIIFGIILLGEIPSVWGILGIILIIGGSYFVLDTTEERFSWRLLKQKEIQYRIGAMVFSAIEAIFIKKTILLSSIEISFVSWCWIGALFSFVILFLFKIEVRTEIHKVDKFSLHKFLYLVICVGIMQFTTNYVFDHMPVGYALSLFQLSVIVSIFFGYKIFKETNIRKKLIGAIIMVAGSVIIILMK